MNSFAHFSLGKGDWVQFFIDLGKYTVENLHGNSRIIALVPSTSMLPFLISAGAMNSFLNGNISTGFKNIKDIWSELVDTPIGTEVHVVDKTNGFIHHKGALKYVSSNTFGIQLTQNKFQVDPGWIFEPANGIVPDIEVSITALREYIVPERAVSTKADPNLLLLNKFYQNTDPLGVLGLPNNIIQIIGNKNRLILESQAEFVIDEIKGSFSEGLITKNVLNKKQELTYIASPREENLTTSANLSIFTQSSNTNIGDVVDWTNEFPQIYLIPRTSRQSYDLVEIFNDEYEDREQTIELTDLNIPIGCEIMGYKI
jgi:hypothetical protein